MTSFILVHAYDSNDEVFVNIDHIITFYCDEGKVHLTIREYDHEMIIRENLDTFKKLLSRR